MAGIIAIVIVMVVINAFMVYAIIRSWERVSDKINKFFLDKTSDIMDAKLESYEKEHFSNASKEVVIKEKPVYVVPNKVDSTAYKNNEFKNDYKNLKEVMSFDKEEVLEKIISENDNETNGTIATNLVKDIKFDVMFELNTLSPSEQEDALRSSFNEKQKHLLDEYIAQKIGAFNSIDFFDYVKQIARKEDPKFYVKTGWKNESFDNVSDKVVTVVDEEITEGIKVVHKDKLYDYSI